MLKIHNLLHFNFNYVCRNELTKVFINVLDFNGFQRMATSDNSIIEVPIPVALNSDVALECDVLDAKPPPQIKWFDDLGEIQEDRLDNSIRFLDDRHYLYLRRLQAIHLERRYYCNITNVNLSQEVSAPTRYILIDNLTQGELIEYKQIRNHTAFVGNASFEFAYVGGAFGDNDVNGTINRLSANSEEVRVLGNVGIIDRISRFLSSPGIILLEASVSYNGLLSFETRSGTVIIHRKLITITTWGGRGEGGCSACPLLHPNQLSSIT